MLENVTEAAGSCLPILPLNATVASRLRVRELARVRVLEYNEDDVRATWHLRRWLREQA